MNYDELIQISKEREYVVSKSNDLVKKAKYALNLTELKIMAYLISKVQPTDTSLKEYDFSIKEFCQVCGIDPKNGWNYISIKKQIENLWHKGFWMLDENGKEIGVQWIVKPTIQKATGRITMRLDEDLQKYIVGLYENFTQYELISVLPMQSTYSIRIYELLKSDAYKGVSEIEVDTLKRQLSAEHYKNFKDFRVKVLEIATREINKYTDLEISWETITRGRKVIKIKFYIRELSADEKTLNHNTGHDKISGQFSFKDMAIQLVNK